MTDEMNMNAPPRLLDDPAVAPELQEGLSEIAATQLPFDTAAGLSAFQDALGSAAQLGAAPAVSTAISTGTLVAGSVVLLLAGAGLYTWLVPSSKAPRQTEPAPSAAPAAPAAPTVAPIAAPEPVVAEPARAPVREVPREVAVQTPLDREVAAMVKAKALVDSKPRAALALLQRIEREHPRGTLSEERTGLRVLALWAAGEHETALGERATFLARYPQSPMRERLMQLEAP
jgi:hypothetical protein